MVYQKKFYRFNLWKLAIILPITATLLMLFSFENASNLPDLSENRNYTPTKNELDSPYALRFGSIDFTLSKQQGDGKSWDPPTFVITHETARKIAQHPPILINRNNNKTYKFQLDLWQGEKSFNPEVIMPNADIAKAFSELNKQQHTHISLKNIKLVADVPLLNLSMEIVPEEGVLLKWGNRLFPFDTKLKMAGNEFIEKIAVHPLFTTGNIFHERQMAFQSMNKINTNGSQDHMAIHSLPFSKNNTLSDNEKAMLLNTKAGDQFIIKGIYLESPNIPSEYSFSVEIIADSNPEIIKELIPAVERPVIRYFLNGKPSDKKTIENLDAKDIIELKRLDKFGKPVEDEKKIQSVIVKTK